VVAVVVQEHDLFKLPGPQVREHRMHVQLPEAPGKRLLLLRRNALVPEEDEGQASSDRFLSAPPLLCLLTPGCARSSFLEIWRWRRISDRFQVHYIAFWNDVKLCW
jgi:hypothetical protein